MTNSDLKAARKRLNLTQSEMALKLNTRTRTYQDWELGRTKLPGLLSVTLELLRKQATP